jgi:hypothetical protein
MHSGGIVGLHGSLRGFVHASYFDDAPRMHGGGLAGLSHDEVPAILQRGERVIARGGDAGGGASLQVKLINENGEAKEMVSERTNEAGELEIRIRTIVDEQLASSRSNAIFRKKYGLSPQTIRR